MIRLLYKLRKKAMHMNEVTMVMTLNYSRRISRGNMARMDVVELYDEYFEDAKQSLSKFMSLDDYAGILGRTEELNSITMVIDHDDELDEYFDGLLYEGGEGL